MKASQIFTAAFAVILSAAAAPQTKAQQPAGAPPSQQQTVPQAQQPPQQRNRTRMPAESQAPSKSPDDSKKIPPPEEKSSVTTHSAHVGGQQINYTATAATYVIKADDGTPKATMFYVAYTKDGVSDVSHRPISFVYNGGPGSASLFTHMGMGPKRVVLTPDGHGIPAPYSIVDN